MAEEQKLKPKLEPSWLEQLHQEFEKDYMLNLKQFLSLEKSKFTVYPAGKEIFNAFWYTPLQEVKVVILGQDPYHGPRQAHGLCFSVQEGVQAPPSLVNIFQELKNDIQFEIPKHGCLTGWAKQGVFLLNTVLSVRAHQAHSHAGRGWESFTDKVIEVLNQKREKLVFLLWGSHAQKKGAIIDHEKHLVLKAPHPSPLSAHRGFLGCQHFSKANHYLEQNGKTPIEWQLTGSN